ncbi:hypothetical protein ACPA9J_33695 [Pseudomonas aeruginosa]
MNSSDAARGRGARHRLCGGPGGTRVVAVLHHLNRPPMAGVTTSSRQDAADAAEGGPFRPGPSDDRVPVQRPAPCPGPGTEPGTGPLRGSLLRIDIEPEPHQTDLLVALDQAHEAPPNCPPSAATSTPPTAPRRFGSRPPAARRSSTTIRRNRTRPRSSRPARRQPAGA